jgi:RNA polymerase sigma-70 factor, ECF subfamily
LPESQKNALILAKLDKMSHAEIAEVMNISSKAVESLVARAKANLKVNLEQHGIYLTKKNPREYE